MRKPTLSPTRIQTYLTCRVKYYWAYLSPLGRQYRRPNPVLAMGANLHRVLQLFHHLGGAATLSREQVAHALETLWSAEGFETPEQSEAHKQLGHTLIGNYYEREATQPSPARTLFTEKMLRMDRGDYVLVGRLDRVDEHPDGTLEIIDYKSQRAVVTEAQVANDFALYCYALLLQHYYPDRPLLISIYALRAGEKATVALTHDQLQEFAQLLDDLAQQILHTDFEQLQPEPIPHCEVCEYLPLCTRCFGLTPPS
ncbi:MAG: PD-(D/E)XK nuclease family protein [Fimbriimonadales bacterium]|nr:PD-(D/E)XK nuclease family protein [Fimbriimonadales bacterium]